MVPATRQVRRLEYFFWGGSECQANISRVTMVTTWTLQKRCQVSAPKSVANLVHFSGTRLEDSGRYPANHMQILVLSKMGWSEFFEAGLNPQTSLRRRIRIEQKVLLHKR